MGQIDGEDDRRKVAVILRHATEVGEIDDADEPTFGADDRKDELVVAAEMIEQRANLLVLVDEARALIECVADAEAGQCTLVGAMLDALPAAA